MKTEKVCPSHSVSMKVIPFQMRLVYLCTYIYTHVFKGEEGGTALSNPVELETDVAPHLIPSRATDSPRFRSAQSGGFARAGGFLASPRTLPDAVPTVMRWQRNADGVRLIACSQHRFYLFLTGFTTP